MTLSQAYISSLVPKDHNDEEAQIMAAIAASLHEQDQQEQQRSVEFSPPSSPSRVQPRSVPRPESTTQVPARNAASSLLLAPPQARMRRGRNRGRLLVSYGEFC